MAYSDSWPSNSGHHLFLGDAFKANNPMLASYIISIYGQFAAMVVTLALACRACTEIPAQPSSCSCIPAGNCETMRGSLAMLRSHCAVAIRPRYSAIRASIATRTERRGRPTLAELPS